MDKKIDRRVLKTKRAIYNAFVELLSEKEINHITITDISKKADINRKTFYNYYSNTYEVMEEIENLTVDTFIKRLDTIEFTNMTDFLTEIFSQFTEIINSDLDFFSHLFKTNNRSILIVKIVEAIKEYIRKRIEKEQELDLQKFNIVADFYIPGILSVYMNWFVNNHNISIEELSHILTDLILHGTEKKMIRQLSLIINFVSIFRVKDVSYTPFNNGKECRGTIHFFFWKMISNHL